MGEYFSPFTASIIYTINKWLHNFWAIITNLNLISSRLSA
jgi:hypothetical protein